MKTKTILFLLINLIIGSGYSQSGILSLDGVDDYVDLGKLANGARTIEFWFKPDVTIGPSTNPAPHLILREIGPVNTNEFNIAFRPRGFTQAGAIQFLIRDGSNIPYRLISDTNTWVANRWYHLAAVVDPNQGMMLFIDGNKQSSTNSSTMPITNVSNSTRLGGTPVFSTQHFKGDFDDVRLSTSALYTSNFTPPCPDLKKEPNSIGVWNFNHQISNIAYDSSSNSNDVSVIGAIQDTATICNPIITAVAKISSIDGSEPVLFPNPVRETISISNDKDAIIEQIMIHDLSGKTVFSSSQAKTPIAINLQNGLYIISFEYLGKRYTERIAVNK